MKEKASLALGQVLLRHMLFRLFLPLLTIGIVAIGGAGYLSVQALINEQKQTTQTMARVVDTHLEQGGRILDAVARSAEKSSPEYLSVFMQSTWETYKHFETVYLLDSNHRIKLLVPFDPRYVGVDMSRLPDIQQTGKTDRVAFSRPFTSLRTGDPTVYLFKQLSNGGRIVGELNLGAFQQEIVEKRDASRKDSIIILDQFGTLLAHPQSSLVKQQTNLSYLKIFDDGSKGKSTVVYEYMGVMVLGSASPVNRVGWVVVDYIPLSVLLRPYAFAMGLMFLVSLGIWWLVVWNFRKKLHRNIVTPLVLLSESADALGIGDFSRVNKLASIPAAFTELNKLVADFLRMSNTLAARQTALENTTVSRDILAAEIEERRKVESELQKLAAIVKNSSELVNLAALDGKMIFLNDAGGRMLGIPPGDVEKYSIMDIIPDELKSRFENEVLSAMLKEGFWKGDLQYRNVITNALIDVHAMTFTIRNSDDKPLYLANVSLDITERKKAEEELRESEDRYRNLFENANEAIFVAQDGKLVFLNPVTCQLIGYSSTELMGRSFIDFVHPDDRNLVAGNYLKRLKGEAFQPRYTFRYLTGDNVIRWLEIDAVRIQWAGKPATLNFGTDVTERKQTETALHTNATLLSTAMKLAHLGHWEYDVARDLFTFNDHIYALLHTNVEREGGYTMSSAQYAKRFVQPEDASLVASEIQKALETSDPQFSRELEHRIVFDDGGIGYISVRYFIAKNDHGRTVKIYGVNQDITERKQAEEKIRKMAYHDSLTGLPNRKLFSDRLSIALAQAQRNQKIVGIAMLDLDNFKGVNDSLGHDVGDLLLKATAERLSAALRKGDTVARFGGDEFMLIIPDLKVIEDAIQIARKIVDNFRKPFLIDTHQLAVTVSIGVAFYPADGTDESMLLKGADIAMYQAKQAGRARYRIYGGA